MTTHQSLLLSKCSVSSFFPGYAPVPTGYGPAQQGYGQQPVYPQQGQQPVYPQYGQQGGQQGGYIAPPEPGMLGGMMNMAPEMALTAGGMLSGNNTMAGLGALATAEKYDNQEDKEDRLRAAVNRGVPPPPMGYAGGAPVPYGQVPQGMNMPPATANYPRQQMK
jgi:hypothetical protein